MIQSMTPIAAMRYQAKLGSIEALQRHWRVKWAADRERWAKIEVPGASNWHRPPVKLEEGPK